MKTIGGLIDALKKGEKIKYRHDNPYLHEAADYRDILITQHELQTNPLFLEQSGIHKNLIIEIGCYFGKTVVELAEKNPLSSILGLDITYKRVVKTARRIKRNHLNNARVALCDGFFLFEHVLHKNELSGVCVFFPDPWPKAREEKNRLLNEEFIRLVFERLKPGGFFWLKTDHEPYFSKTQFLLLQNGFILHPYTPPKYLNIGAYETEFQKMFTQKNIPFFEGVYLKPE